MGIPRGGIAFFDSGIGGLTVLAACRKRLPDEIFYYYGDNRRAPYGNLPVKKIRRYVFRAFRAFEKLKVRAVVLACNTVTAVCVEALRKKYSFPIIGAEPAISLGAKEGGEVFVLSTRATYESERFSRLCCQAAEKFPKAKIRAFACDGLAGAIEKRITDCDVDFTSFLPRGNPQIVVLGCTHYVYIAERIKKFYDCEVVDGNEGIAARLCAVLQSKNEKNDFQNHLRPQKGDFCPQSSSLNAEKSTDKTRSGFWRRKRNGTPLPLKGERGGIFFTGSGKKQNLRIFKQTFANGG